MSRVIWITRVIVFGVLVFTGWLSAVLLSGSLVQRSLEQTLAGNPDAVIDMQGLEMVIALDQGNPDTLAFLAQLQEPVEALNSVRALTALVPHDPFARADLFALKMRLGVSDDESSHALGQAVALGPYEPEVILILLRAGISNWLQLDGSDRGLIHQASIRGVEGQFEFLKTDILAQLSTTGFLAVACSTPELEVYPECSRAR